MRVTCLSSTSILAVRTVPGLERGTHTRGQPPLSNSQHVEPTGNSGWRKERLGFTPLTLWTVGQPWLMMAPYLKVPPDTSESSNGSLDP